MRDHISGSMITVAIAAAALGAVITVSGTTTSAQAPDLKTSWGDPDLQGIYDLATMTPMERLCLRDCAKSASHGDTCDVRRQARWIGAGPGRAPKPE